MSIQDLQSDLLVDLSTEEQQDVSGGFGWGGFGLAPIGLGFGGFGHAALGRGGLVRGGFGHAALGRGGLVRGGFGHAAGFGFGGYGLGRWF